MLLNLTHSSRVLFIGGKGGVGKTSTSSALALAHARQGERVLLVSTDPAHNLGHLWGRQLGDKPQRILSEEKGYVDAVEIDPAATVDAHLSKVQRMMELLLPERLHAHAAQHLALAREAPGSHESAVLERIAELVQLGTREYDRTIFDTAPTGHTLRLLQLPEQLTGWAETLLKNRDRSERFGQAMRSLTSSRDEAPTRSPEAQLRATLLRRKERFAFLRDTLQDRDRVGFVIVLTPERIPVQETLELAEALEQMRMPVLAFVANRCSPPDATGLLAQRATLEATHLNHLQGERPDIPLVRVPLMATEPLGAEGVTRLAERLCESTVGSADAILR